MAVSCSWWSNQIIRGLEAGLKMGTSFRYWDSKLTSYTDENMKVSDGKMQKVQETTRHKRNYLLCCWHLKLNGNSVWSGKRDTIITTSGNPWEPCDAILSVMIHNQFNYWRGHCFQALAPRELSAKPFIHINMQSVRTGSQATAKEGDARQTKQYQTEIY